MDNIKLVAQNKKALHDYFIEEKIEAGLVLTGTEIKSIRAGKVQLKDSYIRFINDEAFWVGGHIAPFEFGNRFNHEETRTRKLLLKKKEISRLNFEQKVSGVSIIPLKIYIKNGFAKIEIAVAKGKKNYDKRQTLKEKDVKREIDRNIKNYSKTD